MPKNVYDLMKELAGFNMDNLMIIRVFETWEKEGADDRMSNKKKIDGESLIKILKSAFESSPGATKNDAVKKYLRMLCVLYLKDNNGATENLYENILKKSGINDSKAILSDAGDAVPEFTSRGSYVQTISKFIDDAIKKEAKQILKKKIRCLRTRRRVRQ